MKALHVLVFAFLASKSSGQLQIALLPTTPNELHFNQLWKFDVLNQYPETKTVRFVGTLEDESGLVIQATSAQLTLATGLTSSAVLETRLRPLTINFIKPQYSDAIGSLTGFPPGAYEWCVEILELGGDNVSAQTCATTTVTIMMPPHLILPEDQAQISETHPVFVWSPPAPVKDYAALSYTITVVELRPGQLPEAALLSNPTHFRREGLKSPVFSYPPEAREFEVAKRYAWTVVAYMSGQAIPAEEVWVFEPIRMAQNMAATSGSYSLLKAKLDADYVTIGDGHLRFAFSSRYPGDNIKMRIHDCHGNGLLQEHLDTLAPVAIGFNKYDLNLGSQIKQSGYYALVISWPSGERCYLRFYYSTDEAYHRAQLNWPKPSNGVLSK